MSQLADIAPRLAAAQELEREERRLERSNELEVKLARARDALAVLLTTYPSGYDVSLKRLMADILQETRVR